MNILNITDSEAIQMYFADLTTHNGFHVFSGLNAGLRDIRQATNRDLITGIKHPNLGHGSWLGCMGYISLLDQIGTCLKPKTVPKIHEKSILRALSYFTNLNTHENMAIYALRCAFAHDFSLYNWNTKKPLLQHRFRVSQGANGPMINLPLIPWNGDINTIYEDSITFVNLELLGDFIEDIIRKLKFEASQDNLEIALPNGTNGFLTRYMNVSRVV